MNIYNRYFNIKEKLLAILIDPEKHSDEELSVLIDKIDKSKIDLIFVGSSLSAKYYDAVIQSIKIKTDKPVLLFPGNSLQLSFKADALLNLSLISGRNSELLIGEHVRSAILLKQSGIEVIPTGYMLIDGGERTSVEYMSNTQSVPRNKEDIAVATAVAGELLGLRTVYLEAGSGAKYSVPNKMIEAVRNNISLPIICGGGIRSKQEIEEKWEAGANIVVVGNAFEEDSDFLNEF